MRLIYVNQVYVSPYLSLLSVLLRKGDVFSKSALPHKLWQHAAVELFGKQGVNMLSFESRWS